MKLPPHLAQLATAFVAVDLGLSVFSRGDYLFTRTAVTGAGDMPSDVVQVAQGLGGFTLVWGAGIGLASIAIVVAGVFLLVRHARARAPPARPRA